MILLKEMPYPVESESEPTEERALEDSVSDLRKGRMFWGSAKDKEKREHGDFSLDGETLRKGAKFKKRVFWGSFYSTNGAKSHV